MDDSTADSGASAANDYRRSQYYKLSETENLLLRDMERMKLLRKSDDETDATATAPSAPTRVMEGKVTSKFRMTSQSSPPIEEEKPLVVNEKVMDEPRPVPRSRRDSIKELDEHEMELKRMAE